MNKFLLTSALMMLAALPAAAGWQAWTAPAASRVLRDAPAGKPGSVALAAACNEVRSFQILMRSDEPVSGIELKAGQFSSGSSEFFRTTLYRQHQLELTQPTTRNTGFKPGWYPDPLIPFVNPLTGEPLTGGRLVAQPFELPANQTHGFWIDVEVLPGAPAGGHRAEFTLTAKGQKNHTFPVTLTVWDFALPEVPSLQTAFGSPAERVKAYYAQRAREGKDREVKDTAALEAQCAGLFADHRIATPPPGELLAPERQADGSWKIPGEKLKALAEFIDKYRVNAVEVSRSRLTAAAREPGNREALAAWLKAFDEAAAKLNRPNLVFYVYIIDEPNDKEAYEHVQKWGKAIREAGSVVRVMTTEQTKTQDESWGDLYGAVDIWCPLFALYDPETAAARQKLGETIWAYTALCQRNPTPWWHIDYPLLNYRVPSWIAWRYRVRGLLYWGAMCHWRDVEDPWTDPWTYGRKKNVAMVEGKVNKALVYNGEGTALYPARAVGYEGVVPSLRLKALRDGIQDYEYLLMLEKMGKAAEAEKIVLPLAESWFKWETDAAAYDEARTRLAELILKK